MNLLWSQMDRKLHVIDQDLAFEEEGIDRFWSDHVFRDSVKAWTSTFRQEMTEAMRTALQGLKAWWQEMPDAWTEVEIGINVDKASNLLWRFENNPQRFWNVK